MSGYSTRFLARNHSGLLELSNRALDTLGFMVSAWVIWTVADAPLEPNRDWILLVLVNTVCNLLAFEHAELYRSWRGRPLFDQLGRLFLASITGSTVTFLIWELLDLESTISPALFLIWLSFNVVLIGAQRATFQLIVRHYRRHGVNSKQILIYGAGMLGRSIALQAKRSPETGYKVVAFLDDDSSLFDKSRDGIPIVGNLSSLDKWLEENDIDEIWLALPLSALEKVTRTLEVADKHMVCVRLFPDLTGLSLLNHSVSEMLGLPIIDLNVNRMQGANRIIKEIEDKLLGSIFLLVAIPVIVAIALMIRLTSEGPIIFRQRRHGWDGKLFTIYKFRSMIVHKEPEGQLTQALRNDDRFTPIGRWLRITSLDELPQLFNVLQGKMSLVGPRPHATEHNNFYQERINGYMRRHRVKPGITGWAQINDLRGEVKGMESMNRRLKHDLYYIEHWSLWFDLRIILVTILKVFFSRNAW